MVIVPARNNNITTVYSSRPAILPTYHHSGSRAQIVFQSAHQYIIELVVITMFVIGKLFPIYLVKLDAIAYIYVQPRQHNMSGFLNQLFWSF